VDTVLILQAPRNAENIFRSCTTGGLSGSAQLQLVFVFVIPFYLQSVPVQSANCVKTRIQWHVEECSVALLCN
jgi:hypothetical protein